MTKTNSTNEEKDILRAYAKTSPLILMRLKAQAVLMASNALSASGASDVLGRSEYTVKAWLRDWRQRRLSSIFTGHAANTNDANIVESQLD